MISSLSVLTGSSSRHQPNPYEDIGRGWDKKVSVGIMFYIAIAVHVLISHFALSVFMIEDDQGAVTPMYPVLAAATGIKFTRYYGYTVEYGNAVVVCGRARKYTILIALNQFLIG